MYPKDHTFRPDIYSFQDIGNVNNIKLYAHEFPGKIICAEGPQNLRGVLLGFNTKACEIVSSEVDRDGRYIVAHVTIDHEPITIVAHVFGTLHERLRSYIHFI